VEKLISVLSVLRWPSFSKQSLYASLFWCLFASKSLAVVKSLGVAAVCYVIVVVFASQHGNKFITHFAHRNSLWDLVQPMERPGISF